MSGSVGWVSTHHATFSAFLRAPTSIVPRVGYQDVLLERRDGDDLLLVDAGRERDTRAALATLAAVISALPDEALHTAAEPVAALAPWSSPLPPHERVVMLREIAQTARAGSDLDDLAPLGQLLREWRSTAEVHANPALLRRLQHAEMDTDEPAFPPAP